MAEKITGVIAKIKENQTRVGKTYSFVLQDKDGVWFSTFKDRPEGQEGQLVEFEYTVNGNFNNVDNKTMKVLKAEAAPKTVRAAARQSQASYDAKQASILYQSSRKDAIAVLGIAFEQGAVTFKSNTKQADKLPILLDMVSELADDLYQQAKAAESPNYGAAEKEAAAEADVDDDIPFDNDGLED